VHGTCGLWDGVERFVERLTAGGRAELQRKTAGCRIHSAGASYKLPGNETDFKLRSNGTGYNFHNRVLVTVCVL
jgi:hypothetical protein